MKGITVMHSDTVSIVLHMARDIKIQEPVISYLSEYLSADFLDLHKEVCISLTSAATASNAWKSLDKELAGKDIRGLKLLSLYLYAASFTRKRYEEAGVSDRIFADTFGCFQRFLREDYERTGQYAFSRGFWAWRQLSCRLFRLGTLEFEYRRMGAEESVPGNYRQQDPVISVHIPSDADLSAISLKESYQKADTFFAEAAPLVCEYKMPVAVICDSWLLSPYLQKLLPPSSGIHRFGADYTVYHVEPEDEAFYYWLFSDKRPPEPLPQKTSLQRRVAAYLATGGKIGVGYGIKGKGNGESGIQVKTGVTS